MAQHRNSVSIPIKPQDCPDLQADKNLRVMVFCAGEGSRYGQDIAFPHQSEIKVNQGDVKANLRGLKNKPGSTRPVDITDYLRLKPPGYSNTVDMTYALTTKVGARNVPHVATISPLLPTKFPSATLLLTRHSIRPIFC
jgi:E3 SUMO-protein ligase PIAS1